MARWITHLMYVVTALLLWAALTYLVFLDDVGKRAAFDLRSVLAYGLLLAAPAATFIPLARWVCAPLYDAEGIVGWGFLGYMVAFVEPADPLSLGQFVALLISLTIALASATSMIAYLIGLRVMRARPRPHDFLPARRQGYLAAFFVVSSIVLGSIGTLTLTSAAMMLVIVVLMELLVLARSGRGFPREGMGARRTGNARAR